MAAQQPVTALQALAGPAVDRASLAAWRADWHRRYNALSVEHSEACDAIVARLGPDGWSLANELDTAIGNSTNLEIDRVFALLAAHLPGIAPALRLVFEHLATVGFGHELDCCAEVSLPPL
jgi:hypothetical protein